jgi:hypothetical protein
VSTVSALLLEFHPQRATGSVRIAQSATQRAMGCTLEGSEFEYYVIQTGSGARPMSTGGSFPGDEAADA